jgi:hypothetical protein
LCALAFFSREFAVSALGESAVIAELVEGGWPVGASRRGVAVVLGGEYVGDGVESVEYLDELKLDSADSCFGFADVSYYLCDGRCLYRVRHW